MSRYFTILFVVTTITLFATVNSVRIPPPIICDRPNEHYECGSACQTECRTLGQICPIVNIRCNDDCYCNNGYARNDDGVCIPISECPE
ncbi:hypothetical protein M0802_009376 [Mischocyttarus mexicanus]|nr:hypothetical protein M0802_009376 [Mischocyttarus mexicanus]